MTGDKKELVLKRLAAAHFRVDSAIESIFRVISPDRENEPDEPIKLLEINRETPRQGIVPIRFAADAGSGIDYPSIIIEIAPEELDEIQAKNLKLPHDWVLGPEIRRPVEAA